MITELKVSGRHLVNETNEIVRLPGFSAFALLKRDLMTNGRNALTIPTLDMWRDVAVAGGYGEKEPLVPRVFRHAGGTNAFAMDPWSYAEVKPDGSMSMPRVRDLSQFCLSKGFIIDWSAGDYQLNFPTGLDGPRGVHQHHNVFCASISGDPAIWNVTNEPFKNGLDPANAPPPPWAPRVQYSGQYDPFTGALGCINLHTDRSTEGGAQKWVGKAHESAPYLWLHDKPIFYDEPMGAFEVVMNGRSNVPHYFGVLGSVISMVDAVYFHSTAGLSCDGLGPITRKCAVEFFKGVVGGLKVAPR